MSPVPITGMEVSAGLTEAFGLTGKLPLQLDTTVVPTVVVGNLEQALWGPRAVGSISVPATVDRGQIEIAMPVDLATVGAAVIVDSLELAADVDLTIDIGESPGLPLPNLTGNKAWLDVGQRGAPVMLINGRNNAAGVGGFTRLIGIRIQALTTQRFDVGWILRANPETGVQQGLLIRPTADDRAINLNVYWRERVPR